jgi:hypothetical protein
MKRARPIKAKVHLGAPLEMRGWKLIADYIVIARYGSHKLRVNGGTELKAARELGNSLLAAGPWETVDIIEQERIRPRKR